jgi:protein-disulfide isomerase
MKRFRYVSAESLGGMAVVLLGMATLVMARYREPPSAAAAAPPPDHVGELLSIETASTMGRPDTKVTLVVFTDYQCPFCARFALATMPDLVAAYVDSGRVDIALVNNPLEKIHPLAFAAAQTAECAAGENKFWQVHDLLFQNQKTLSEASFAELWSQAGLQPDRLAECRRGGAVLAKIRAQSLTGDRFNVTGTPTLVIGRRAEPGKIRVERRFDALPLAHELAAALDEALRK